MDAITKFQKFLVSELEIVKENFKQIRNSPIIEEDEKILLSKLFISKNYLRLIQIWRKKIKNELFYDFEPLCILLKCANIKATDCFKILITSIESNIATGFLDDNVDNNQISKFQIKVADSDKDLGETVVNIITEDLGLEEENYKLCCKNEKIAIHENPSIDLTTMRLAHNMIKIHYLEKKENYELGDIDKIVTAFSKLEIPNGFCQSFQIVLERNLNKRHQKTQEDPIVYKKLKPSKQTDSITPAEYKAIRKQIETSYNEYTGKILIPITEESRNQIASLMIQLDYDRKRINLFYQDVERSIKKTYHDSIEEFISLYPKIEFYSEFIPQINELLEEAIAYHYETFGCREAEYGVWYQAFQQVFLKLKMRIPQDYKYEYVQAMALVEQEKQKKKELIKKSL